MTLLSIPLSSTDANQSVSAVLDGKLCQIGLTTTDYGLFANLAYDGVSIAYNAICQDRRNLNPNTYLGMPQPLFFADLQGTTDPVADGFGTRYLLLYGNPDASG